MQIYNGEENENVKAALLSFEAALDYAPKNQ